MSALRKGVQALLDKERENELAFAESFVSAVYDDLNDIKHSFFRIGFRLSEAAHLRYYAKLGYANITDLAQDKFGFSKSTTYELMGIYNLAHSEDSPLQIADKYDEYSQSQLREFCRLKLDPNSFMQIVKPSDKVEEIGRAVTFWNKYVCKHSGTPDVNNITELLELDIDTPMHEAQAYLKRKAEQAEAKNSAYAEKRENEWNYAGQLPGQIGIDYADQPEEFSAYAENSAVQHNKTELEPAVMSDDELIDFVLRYGPRKENGKLRIVEFYTQPTAPLQYEFVKFVSNEYGYGGCRLQNYYFKSLDSDNKKLTIERNQGGKIVMPWSVVAGHISRLITAGEYLTKEEKEIYLHWKAEKDGVEIPSEAEVQEKQGFSAYAEKSASAPSVLTKKLNEEYGEEFEIYDNVTLRSETPDDELVEYCLTSDCHVSALGTKLEIYDRYFLMEPTPFFMEFIVNCYSNFSAPDKWGKGGHFDRLESDTRRGLIIYRIGGGALILEWPTVTGKIMNLIKAGKYLTDEEREKFERERARKTANEKAQRQQTRREYLATLPVGEFVTELLLEVSRVYPLGKNSAALISNMRQRLVEWLNVPIEVKE